MKPTKQTDDAWNNGYFYGTITTAIIFIVFLLIKKGCNL